MPVIVLLFCMTLFVAYSNGANDNFKGVATLYGANVAGYKTTITVATIATLAGCITSVFLAQGLVQVFSGKGLVPDAVAMSPNFILAAAAGAGVTVILATALGFPISTTHSLTGGLIGAGFVAAGDKLDLGVLGSAFVLPLLVSPLIAILMTMPLYKLAHVAVEKLGITKRACLCVAPGTFLPLTQLQLAGDAACGDGQWPPDVTRAPAVITGTAPACVDKFSGDALGVTVQRVVDGLHYLSGAAVSFARGLNDTPKIVGLLLVVRTLNLEISTLAIAVAMAAGGLLNARRVAETMGKKISRMNDGQALTANLVTASLVIFASRLGMPVSTTHVSVGSITGIGIVNRSADKGVIRNIVLSWALTLPVAAVIGMVAYVVCAHVLSPAYPLGK